MSKCVTVTLLVLAVPTAIAVGEGGPKPAPPNVAVRLSFSAEEYDPSAASPSQAAVRCVVRNDTAEAVEVPVGYDGERVRVQSGQLTLYRRMKGEGDVKLVRVEPGKEVVVFELPLDQVLGGARGPADPWRWDWPRRPEPPRSPVHKYRQPGFVDRATFSATLKVSTGAVTSDPVVLKIKPANP
jgi:hypothetical protein